MVDKCEDGSTYVRTYVRLGHIGTERKEGTVCTGTKDAVNNLLTYDLQREESDVRTYQKGEHATFKMLDMRE